MRHRLTQISVAKTAGVLAIVYLVLSALFFIPFGLLALAIPQLRPPVWGPLFLFVMPLFYAVCGFLVICLFALIYNVVASRTGGIEVTWSGSLPMAGPPTS